MIETKRPIFFSGENPGLTLHVPGTEQIVATASYWHCTDSPWGVGHALVLWLATNTPAIGHGGVFTNNLGLARVLVENLTQYFFRISGYSYSDFGTCRSSLWTQLWRDVISSALPSAKYTNRVGVAWRTGSKTNCLDWLSSREGDVLFDHSHLPMSNWAYKTEWPFDRRRSKNRTKCKWVIFKHGISCLCRNMDRATGRKEWIRKVNLWQNWGSLGVAVN